MAEFKYIDANTVLGIKHHLAYDPESGILTWRVHPNPRHKFGGEAGCTDSNGYVVLGFRGKKYYAHRIAWLLFHDEQPEELDHVNGVRSDNRIGNLRRTERLSNAKNIRIDKKTTSGVRGVRITKHGIEARVICDGVLYRKSFKHSELEESISWVQSMRDSLHKQYSRNRN